MEAAARLKSVAKSFQDSKMAAMTLRQLWKDARAYLRGSGGMVRHRRTLERQGLAYRRDPENPYHSQVGQDRFLAEQIFKGKHGGVFVDIGAYDGVHFSNTCYFERELGWTGLCVEPDPAVFARLLKSRTCKCENCCVADFTGKVKFNQFVGAEMFSGIAQESSVSEKQRRAAESKAMGGELKELEVPCFTPADLFARHGLKRINYLSIDAEGMDFSILKAIDLKQFDIGYISIENNHFAFDYQIMEYMDGRGYELAGVVGDEIYAKKG
jgi:FkbM family methyltransferase